MAPYPPARAGAWGLFAQFPAPLEGDATAPGGARGTARPAPTRPHGRERAGPYPYAETSDRSPPHSVWKEPSRSARRYVWAPK